MLTADGALQARIADPRHKLRQDLLGRGRGRRRRRSRSPRSRAASISATVVTAPAQARAIAEPPGLWPRDPPIRVRKAIPTAWLEITLDRRPQPAGAADDRRGRAAHAAPRSAARSARGRSTASRPGAWREESASARVLSSAPFDAPTSSPSRRPAPAPCPSDRALAPSRPPRRPDRAMIRRLLARLLPRPNRPREPRVYGPADHPIRRDQLSPRRARGDPPAAGRRLQGLRRRRRRARPPARHRAQGLRHRDRRHARSR